MGQEFLDIVLGQDASATSCGTGILPVDPCKEKLAVSKRSCDSGEEYFVVFVRVIN